MALLDFPGGHHPCIIICLAVFDSPTLRFGESGKKYMDVPRGTDEACPRPEDALAKFHQLFAD